MTKKIIFTVLIFTLFLSSCNLPFGNQPGNTVGDSNPSTQAAQTVEALLTAQAVQAPQNTATHTPANNVLPTNTLIPLPTNTSIPLATPTQNCDGMKFVTDVTIPDDTVMTPGQTFTKTWRLQNSGTCSWTPSYVIVFSSGNAMAGPTTQALSANVNPGGTVDISANFTAPTTSGTYTASYKIRNAAGVLFGDFYVRIKVGDDSAFAVTSVNYTTSTWGDGVLTVNCPKVTASITVSKAGTVNYHWVRDDSSGGIETLVFDAPGTKSISYEWKLGSSAAGPSWVGIYIDDPNHQDFGHKNVVPCTTP